MLNIIDNLLDRITMYRLLLYYLIVLVCIAFVLSVFGVLHYNAFGVGGSALFAVAVCWLTNKLFAYIFEVPTNIESTHITALILALIISPVVSVHNVIFLLVAGVLATASKYILAIRKKHIFNPAAIAVVLTAFAARQSASWWIGSSIMLPYVLIGGLLLARKIQRGKMIGVFLVAAIASTAVFSAISRSPVMSNVHQTLLHSSLFFLGFVMLTEPATAPPPGTTQVYYAMLVGILFPPQLHFGGLYLTPELALVIGNVYAFVVSPKLKLLPKLKDIIRTGPSTRDFVFALDRPARYKPGQYMEWTLGHEAPDNRGNRRYFTLASSPTEPNLRLGVKFYNKSSSYKVAMLEMDGKTPLVAAGLGGDFVLPNDPTQKLAFIAGGIGVTPYRSMVKYLLDKNEPRNIVLLYSEKQVADFTYLDVFGQGRQHQWLKTIYTLTDLNAIPADWAGQRGKISAEMIKTQIPDYAERMFYISGPHSMVTAVRDVLHGLGVPRYQIKIDFFPGYA